MTSCLIAIGRLLKWTCGFALLTVTLVLPVWADERLNVLVIVADDLNNDLSCYGHDLVQSPHIDALAARGLRFERAYCQYPLCNPTGASFLSGLRPDATGVFDNGTHFRKAAPDIVTLPEHFRRNGYITAGIGKLFHDGVPKGTTGLNDARSWDVSINPQGREGDQIDAIQSLIPGSVGGTVSWLADDGDPDQLTDAVRASSAIEWLTTHHTEKKEPFFLAVGFYRPHTPYVAPASYFDAYPMDRIELPESPFTDRDDVPLAALPDKQEQLSMSDDQRRQAIQGYYASTSFMDTQVGRLLDRLDELDLTSRTVVVFLSDHGYHLGEHGLWQKRSLFEESARVPLIISAPGVASRGLECRRLVELVDLYPTLVDLCGLPAPDHLQGRSLKPLLNNPDAPFRQDALTQVVCATHSLARPDSPHGYSIRTERYRYTEWNGGWEGVELYDHANDPGEHSNRAFDRAYAEIVTDLRYRLAQRISGSRAEVAKTAPLLHDAANAKPSAHIVTLGDSITKGVRRGVQEHHTFAKLLEQSLSQAGLSATVTNAGIGGERTDQALKRLDQIISTKPDLVTIMYGTNDSYVETEKSSSRLSPAKYRANLTEIVGKFRAAGIIPILMTEPCFGGTHRPNGLGEHPNVPLANFMNHCRQVASESKVPLVDHFRYWTRQNDSGIDIGGWTTDQCHPNVEGHRQLATRMLPAVSMACTAAGIAPTSGAALNNGLELKHVVAVTDVCAWPNLTLLPDGTIAAIIFNQPSHGQSEGDVECWASRDGLKWQRRGTVTHHNPNTIRMNHAAGLAGNGDLIVLCSDWTNEKQTERPKQLPFRDAVLRAWVLRSSDGGRTWEKREGFPAPDPGWAEYIPFGDIWIGEDGALHTSCYHGKYIDPTKTYKTDAWRSWHFRSDDDGRSWKPVSIIGPRHNETNLFPLGGNAWLAAARIERMELFRSDDHGATWGQPQPVTERNEINGHLARLKDGRLLLSYGVRVRGRRGVCGKLSGDNGQSWGEPVRLAHTVGDADCGYPSSVQRADGKIVTAWYSRQTPHHDGYHMGVTIWSAPAMQ